ncbi:LysR family transcriptional regulator [Teredinibacter waterburyi]|jgi:Transcriptional regulator|uniref:LysR family transcriptional regulator n=1 Tax=Teredinibacter waterburyi TaxID=1500538 RepID=UPI00165F8D64|nr:LysR family transcriptional regulator [Teredinibacter waterburyi]
MNLANLDFLKLDPRYFKAFVAAAEYENFSLAATEAAMTQSGISQHISKLEEQLGVALFMRSSKATMLTIEGKTLLAYIRTYNDSIAKLMDSMHKERKLVEGIVGYAMPPSCLLSPHFPMLLERRLQYPSLELNVQLLPNDEILPLVIDGKIDFGFVTEKVEHPLLSYRDFCDEEYILVSATAADVEDLSSDNLLQRSYINYPGMGVYFNYWVNFFMPESKHISNRSLHHAGEINSIEGAIHMVAGGLGIAVFPRHCVQHLVDDGKLHVYQDEQKGALLNRIHIVSRNSPELPTRVSTVVQWFMDMQNTDH